MLDSTGERFLPWMEGAQIHYEHLHRYAFAAQFVKGKKKVLDLACGEGYGPYMLSKEAEYVVGIEINEQVVNHAKSRYSPRNLEFMQGSILEVPIEGEKKFDVIVCFEGIEHVAEHDQLLSEVKRLLTDDGLLIMSTPNKLTFTDDPGVHNPFHEKELYFDEFKSLLGRYFKNMHFLGQRVYAASNLWDLSPRECSSCKEFVIGRREKEFYLSQSELKVPLYFIALASDADLEPYISTINSSWLVDVSNTLLRYYEKKIIGLCRALQAKDAQVSQLQIQMQQTQ